MQTFSNASLADINEEGSTYLYSLIVDYQKAVREFGYIGLREFIREWNCIPSSTFMSLCIGDVVYDTNGTKYIAITNAYECFVAHADSRIGNIECKVVNNQGNVVSQTILSAGDAYSSPIYNNVCNYYKKRQIKRKELELCPILITKKKQQN